MTKYDKCFVDVKEYLRGYKGKPLGEEELKECCDRFSNTYNNCMVYDAFIEYLTYSKRR